MTTIEVDTSAVAAIVQLIDIAAERGAYKGSELSSVGSLRDSLVIAVQNKEIELAKEAAETVDTDSGPEFLVEDPDPEATPLLKDGDFAKSAENCRTMRENVNDGGPTILPAKEIHVDTAFDERQHDNQLAGDEDVKGAIEPTEPWPRDQGSTVEKTPKPKRRGTTSSSIAS